MPHMSRRAARILLSDQEQAPLHIWARSRTQPQRVVQRAQIILLAAEGVESQMVAHQVGTSDLPCNCGVSGSWR